MEENMEEITEEKEMENLTEKGSPPLYFELGDIIEIHASSHPDIHQNQFLITYIDSMKIKLINITTGEFHQLNVLKNGRLSDESITQIILLNRSEESGFARQNALLPRVWIDIHFGGEVPTIITGEITNLEEDCIEITTFPDLRVLYIDFAYQGIPENLPIESIEIREKPVSVGKIDTIRGLDVAELEESVATPEPSEMASIETTPTGETIMFVPENAKTDENIRESLHSMYIDAHSIVFGERLQEVANLVEIPESQQRYSIETQVNDLMDELLSTVPTSQRTPLVLDTVHLLVERFKELRQTFSHFDTYANLNDTKTYGAFYKPLVEHILHMDTKLSWLLPVIKMRRKIYDVENSTIDADDTILENVATGLREIEAKQMAYYKDNSSDLALEYSNLNAFIADWLLPFELPIEGDGDAVNCITNLPIHTNTTTIIDNLGDFHSTAFVRPADKIYNRSDTLPTGLIKRRFLQQTVTTGLTRLEEHISHVGKKAYTRAKMTKDDSVCLKSLLLGPMPIVKYSTIFLPGTPLKDTIQYHQTPFYLFRLLHSSSRKEIPQHEINDFSKEINPRTFGFSKESLRDNNVVEGSAAATANWRKDFREFTVNPSVLYESDSFLKMLEVVIPKTRDLLKGIESDLTTADKTNFHALVSTLRPFMVFPEHITYQQYNHIRFLIKENLRELKKDLDIRMGELRVLKTAKYAVYTKMNSVLRLLYEKTEISNLFLKAYGINTLAAAAPPPSAELLSHIYASDNGQLFTNFITSILITVLNTPQNILDGFVPAEIDDISRMEKIKATNTAIRYLAKRYTSIRELQKDNNIDDDLYYDKEFDDTPYEILDRYRQEQQNMSPEIFFEYLIENLIQKHECPKDMAREMAAALIAHKKRVVDGEYAIVEILPHLPKDVDTSSLSAEELVAIDTEAQIRKKTEYYKRRKGIWINDPSIGDEAFLDNTRLFTNISAAFYKKTDSDKCKDISTAARMKQLAENQYTKELERRVTIHAEDLEKILERNIEYHLKGIRRLNDLKEIQAYRANRVAYTIGTYANKMDLIISPHQTLCDLILEQPDFSKRQFDICQFVDMFCREPMVAERDESPAWLYCKDTNTPLFPVSLYSLANVFISGGSYLEELNRICRIDGILSDDGNAIVDKHTGRILRKIDFVTEEEFSEEGFRITSHAVLEKDIVTIMEEAKGKGAAKGRPVFENELNQTIYNIIDTICGHIDIPIEEIEAFVMRITVELADKHIAKSEAYERRSAKQEKEKGKRLPPYSKYRDETLLYIIASVVLVAIQTAIPSFRTRKTFPGCVRSFSGYPLNGGVEDMSAIQYIACVMKKTAISTAVATWGAIKGYTPEILSKRIKDAVENYILKRSDIEQLYMQKREYMLLNPETIVPEEHSIARWRHFLPPVVPFEIVGKLHPISADFSHDLMELLRNGKRGQYNSFAVLVSKIVQYGYAIIELINNIVQSKSALLKTSTNIPFLENACCNEEQFVIPFLYFKEQDNRIAEYTKHVKTVRLLSTFVKQITIAPLFYHVPFTGIHFPAVPTGQLEETIYSAVIHYCHLDRSDLPIPAIFSGIIAEKPSEYMPSWTLLEKIEFLKRNGKRFGISTLNQLMRIVNEENQVQIEAPLPFSDMDAFREIVSHFDTIHSTIFSDNIRTKILAVLQSQHPKQMTFVDSPALKELKGYLAMSNRNMYRAIMDFFDTYGNLTTRNYQKVGNFLADICDWKQKRAENTVYDDELFRVLQYVKNMIYMFSKVYPSILQGKDGFYSKVHSHWELSEQHKGILAAIFKKYFSGIDSFRSDNVLKLLLSNITPKINEIYLFLQHLPIQTEITKSVENENGEKENRTFHGMFDKPTIYALLTYCVFSTLYEYIIETDNTEVLRNDVQEFKRQRRMENAAMADESEQLASNMEGGMLTDTEIDADTDIQEVQIDVGNKLELKQRLCSLLITCLEVDQENKMIMGMTYHEVMEKVNRSKEKEKRSIIESFSKMGEQRRVENMLKNFRIGRWNVGQQRGLIEYDKDTFDREIDELKLQVIADVESGREDMVTEMVRDIYDIEMAEQMNAEQEADLEAFDIGDLGENYMDGEYYPEDRDEDFRDD